MSAYEPEEKYVKEPQTESDGAEKKVAEPAKENAESSAPLSWQRSEGMQHDTDAPGRENKDGISGYEPHQSETGDKKQREMFDMRSAYSDVSFGSDKRNSMTVTVSERRRHNAETLGSDRKLLKGPRRRRVVRPMGEAFTNSADPVNSAFMFRAQKGLPEKKILERIYKYREKYGNDTLDRGMPFLTLRDDRARLRALARDALDARAHGFAADDLEREKQTLAGEIAGKEEMRKRFLKKLHIASLKARKLSGDTAAQAEAFAASLIGDNGDAGDDKGEDAGNNGSNAEAEVLTENADKTSD